VVRRRRKRKLRVVAILAVCCAIAVGVVLLRGRSTQRPALLLPPGCELGPTTAGIDVSYYQGDITWQRVRRAGVQFAFIRAYDGTDVFDVKFVANWSGAKQAGLLRGAYQFFRPELSALDQADAL
jgi:hypothetical protein